MTVMKKIEVNLRQIGVHEIASEKSERSNQICKIIHSTYDKLSKEEQGVIRKRYFLNETIEKTMSDLGLKRWKFFSLRKKALEKFTIAFAGSEYLLNEEEGES